MNKDEPGLCCPKFNPNRWERKTVTWKNKAFILETLPQLFHMPIPWMVGKMISRMWEKAKAAKANPKIEDFIWLSHDPSPWKSENYIAVRKHVPDAKNVSISGKFITRVFDGPYNKVPVWISDMEKYVGSKSMIGRKYYFYFTTCPKCAREYGHNYVVIFAQVA